MSRLALISALCGMSAGTAAFAGMVDPATLLNVGISFDGGNWSSMNAPDSVTGVSQNDDGDWVIEGAWSTSNWAAEWTFQIDPGSVNRGGMMEMGVVVSSFSFTNTTGVDGNFQLTVNAFVNALSAPTTMTGSMSGSLGSGNPLVETAQLGVPGGDFMYTALADGVGVRTLVDDSFALSTDLTAAFGSFNFSNEAGPAVANSMGIRHSFSLSDDDNVNFVGAFVVTEVPAPGAAALFGLAGLSASRRRR